MEEQKSARSGWTGPPRKKWNQGGKYHKNAQRLRGRQSEKFLGIDLNQWNLASSDGDLWPFWEARNQQQIMKFKGRIVQAARGRNLVLEAWDFKEHPALRYIHLVLDSIPGRLYVDGSFTSITCNSCRFIHEENRPEQDWFKCLRCGHEDNADTNAARNICDRGVERYEALSDMERRDMELCPL